MLAALECDHGTNHREPYEEERGEFVAPHQWIMQRIAKKDICQQQANFCHHQTDGDHFSAVLDAGLETQGHSADGVGPNQHGGVVRRRDVVRSRGHGVFRGLGQGACVFLENRPRFLAVLFVPFGIEAGFLQCCTERGGVHLVEGQSLFGELRLQAKA